MRSLMMIGSAIGAAAGLMLLHSHPVHVELSALAFAPAPLCAMLLAVPAVYLLWEQSEL